MDAVIAHALKLIDDGIAAKKASLARLEQARALLLAEYQSDDSKRLGTPAAPSPELPLEFDAPPANSNGSAGRKEELIRFLQTKGPVKRARILAETKIPKGTVGYLLNQPEFTRDDDGRWHLADKDSAQEIAN